MFRCFALIQLDFAIAFVLVNGLLSLVRSGTACSRAPRHVHSSFSNELYYISIWKFVYLLFYSCFIIVASYATRVALLLKLNMHFASGLHVSCAVFRWEKCIVFFFWPRMQSQLGVVSAATIFIKIDGMSVSRSRAQTGKRFAGIYFFALHTRKYETTYLHPCAWKLRRNEILAVAVVVLSD